MKKIKIFITFSACVIIQVQLSRIFPFLRIMPIQFLLIFLIYYCLDYDWFNGMLAGILAGAILDIMSGGKLGVYSMSYGIIGMLIGAVQPMIFKEDMLPRLFIVFAATVVIQILNYNILRTHQQNILFAQSLLKSILPGALLNCAAAAPILLLVRKYPKGNVSWNRGRRKA